MNTAQLEWIRAQIVGLVYRGFCGGMVLGWTMVLFLKRPDILYLIIGAAGLAYYGWSSFRIYDELGTRMNKFVDR